ncbi:MAG: XdhC family protein, partial [Elusimicrobiota bacterium]
SAPVGAGGKMWVTGDVFYGTLGGGAFEYEALRHCRELLKFRAIEPHLKEFSLCKKTGQCCGGRVEVFFEMIPKPKTAHLFGAGHVGRATAEALCGMPFDIRLIDERESWACPGGLPGEVRVIRMDPLDYARQRAWSASDAVCIFTHSHDLDFALAQFFLGRPVGYLGLIGSEHKARIFQARLACAAQGEELQKLWDEKMKCPIGIPLKSKHVKIIAVAIVVEMLEAWGLESKKPALLQAGR